MKIDNNDTTQEQKTNNDSETQEMKPPRAAAESDVKRAEKRAEEAEQRADELRERNEDLQEIVDEKAEQIDELRQRLESAESGIERLREDKAESERVEALEGDVTCTGCGGQIDTEHVQTVFQEKGDGGGVLGPDFTGLVESVNCPKCSETVDVTHLPDGDRERITNELKRAGVAAGEPTVSTSADQDGADVEQEDDRADAGDDQGEDQEDE